VRFSGWLVLATLAGVAGVALIVTGWTQARPPLHRVVSHLRREAAPAQDGVEATPTTLGRHVVGLARRAQLDIPGRTDLRLVERPVEVHAGYLVLGAASGVLVPLVVLGVLQALDLVSLGVVVPLGLALVGGVLVPLLVHSDLVARADRVRTDLRHQLSAYLDVVTMLLAGNTGHEGALEQAASAGDGRLFVELRRRMREVGATGHSLIRALAATGADLGLVELEQVAATAALSASEGAPVARSLAAKCATLRSTLASEQETDARLRTGKITAPMVGMALVFMALVVYPALNFT
jgi:Flp pilus assembly protein TadB